jgi:hypothetical protein
MVVLVLVAASSLAWALTRQRVTISQPKPPEAVSPTDPRLAKFVDYKKWTLVNPTPELMDPVSAIACDYVRAHPSPHAAKWVSVYVNDVGREAMMARKKPTFPVGSAIIKEKLNSKTSTTPELLTVMVKHEPGYDPNKGDWEYLVLNGSATEISKSGILDECQSCHTLYKHTDYITRTYLPKEVAQALK